jgi:hypothetical protein
VTYLPKVYRDQPDRQTLLVLESAQKTENATDFWRELRGAEGEAIAKWRIIGLDDGTTEKQVDLWLRFDEAMQRGACKRDATDEMLHRWYRRKLREAPQIGQDIYQFKVEAKDLVRLKKVDKSIDRKRGGIFFPGVIAPIGEKTEVSREKDPIHGCYRMPSHHPGICRVCEKPYTKDDPIAFFPSRGGARGRGRGYAVHDACVGAPSREAQLQESIAELSKTVAILAQQLKEKA